METPEENDNNFVPPAAKEIPAPISELEIKKREERKKDLLKEIDLIQAVINRMSYNSFLIKGWGLTLVTLVFSLQKNAADLYLAFVPLLSFWLLDAYFLRQERLFRRLYVWVINNRLQTEEHLFSLNPGRFIKDEQSQLRIMLSITLVIFYGFTAFLMLLFVMTHR